MSRLLYDIFLAVYFLSANISARFNPKARKWVDGRAMVWHELKRIRGSEKRIWFHCASLGEYEQALPLIEKLQGSAEIVITFFSPSGYEAVRNRNSNALILYLPHDSRANAKRFLDVIQPVLAVFVRYDLWFCFLKELHQRHVPAVLISAVFRDHDVFFQWYGGLFRDMLRCFSRIFVQDEVSQNVLAGHGFTNATKAGDTRIDRVAAIQRRARPIPKVERFKGQKRVFIAGSLEPKDESVVLPLTADTALLKRLKFIIVPHHVGREYVRNLMRKIKGKAAIYSGATPEDLVQSDVLLVDTIGMLPSLYRYADLAYVGGGFGEGLHNVLEPAVWGVPVLIGPRHQKFPEAAELIRRQGAFITKSSHELRTQAEKLLSDHTLLEHARNATARFIGEYQGGTETISEYLFRQIPMLKEPLRGKVQ